MFLSRNQYMPVVFPEHIAHSQVKLEDNIPEEGEKQLYAPAISAGFWGIRGGKVETYGKSDSLELSTHRRDADLITKSLAGAGTSHFLA
jgi:hypothetical protein